MPSQEALVRIHIAGRWSADDFSVFMRTANDIYCLSIILSADLLRDPALRQQMFPLDRRNVRRIAATIAPKPWLDVRKISYASPGSIDLLGIGAVLGHVKDFSLNLMDRYQTRDFRKLELSEKLSLAERARFEDEISRNQQLSLARHVDTERALDLRKRHSELEKLALENQALRLTNLDNTSAFAKKMVVITRENDLSREEMQKVAKWIDSRAAPVRDLIELKQVVDIEILPGD